jgi:hypothetical protein
MPRTTLDLDPSIIRELKRRAEREGKSMGQVASEALARSLDRGAPTAAAGAFRWIAADLGRPRIDLEDKEAVQAILDDRS